MCIYRLLILFTVALYHEVLHMEIFYYLHSIVPFLNRGYLFVMSEVSCLKKMCQQFGAVV